MLTQYARDNPTGDWVAFREADSGESYKKVRKLIFSDQGGLCAYCESKVSVLGKHQQRVEHYHSKSDKSDANKNWALEWCNVIGVCLGGSDSDKATHPLPINLSCDSYKDHLVTKGKVPLACEGSFLNPLEMATFNLFSFNKGTGELLVDLDACLQLAGVTNCYGTMAELVEKTIEILNLNCDRLKEQRLEVLKSYNQELTKARKSNDREWHAKLAGRWFGCVWPSFFSTRRILLGQHAEKYLQQIPYNG